MPSYEYHCKSCDTAFEIRMSIAEYSAAELPACPTCGERSVGRRLAVLNVLGASGASARGDGGGCCAPGSCGCAN